MMPPVTMYSVKVHYLGLPLLQESGFEFGPFESRETAETALVSVMGRADVRSAQIVEVIV